MKKLQYTSNGFAILEIVIIILVMLLIGVGGYFVIRHEQIRNNNFCLTKTTNPLAEYGSVIGIQNGYLNFSAVNLRLPVTGNFNNLLAVCVPPYNDGSSASSKSPVVTFYQFSTKTLENASSSCTPENGNSLGGISILSSYEGTGSLYGGGWGKFIKNVGNYYVYYSGPQDTCYKNGHPPTSFINLQQQEQQQLISTLSNITKS